MRSSISSRSRSAKSRDVDRHAELRQDIVGKPSRSHVCGCEPSGTSRVDERSDDTPDDVENASLLRLPVEQLVPHAVDGLPLLVHHVVVFEQVFTSGEVLRFHRLLRRRNAAW